MIAWSTSWAGQYYSIIFLTTTPPPPHTHTHPTPHSYPKKNQIGHHLIKMLFFVGLHDKRKHFTLFKDFIYDCLLNPRVGQYIMV